jgi:hypothetical protein
MTHHRFGKEAGKQAARGRKQPFSEPIEAVDGRAQMRRRHLPRHQTVARVCMDVRVRVRGRGRGRGRAACGVGVRLGVHAPRP